MLIHAYDMHVSVRLDICKCDAYIDTLDARGGSMRLTLYSDYAMRVLVYLGTHGDRLCSIAEIARGYGISQNHLMKVVNDLSRAGYVESVRGRFGGIRLARPAGSLNIGEIIRHTEEGFDLVDCPNCVIAPACGLTKVLCEAVGAFLQVLDRYTLADLIGRRAALAHIFSLPSAGANAGVSGQIAASPPPEMRAVAARPPRRKKTPAE